MWTFCNFFFARGGNIGLFTLWTLCSAMRTGCTDYLQTAASIACFFRENCSIFFLRKRLACVSYFISASLKYRQALITQSDEGSPFVTKKSRCTDSTGSSLYTVNFKGYAQETITPVLVPHLFKV